MLRSYEDVSTMVSLNRIQAILVIAPLRLFYPPRLGDKGVD